MWLAKNWKFPSFAVFGKSCLHVPIFLNQNSYYNVEYHGLVDWPDQIQIQILWKINLKKQIS